MRNDGGWIKTSSPMFDKWLQTGDKTRVADVQFAGGFITLTGSVWTPGFFSELEVHDVYNATGHLTAETYTINLGAQRVEQFRLALAKVLLLDDIEINPVQAGPGSPSFQIVGFGDDPLDIQSYVSVQFGVLPVESDLRVPFAFEDFATQFADRFNELASPACSVRDGTCLRASAVAFGTPDSNPPSQLPMIIESTEVKDIVMDVPVNITASDGSVVFGRQGYSGSIYTASGGDFGIITQATSASVTTACAAIGSASSDPADDCSADETCTWDGNECLAAVAPPSFSHIYGGDNPPDGAYAWMLNEQCAGHILYSASPTDIDNDAGYDVNTKAGCIFDVLSHVICQLPVI